MASDPHYRLLTAEEFLAIDFGSDIKAELDNGVIRMMTGGTFAHARAQRNLMRFLGSALRGAGCSPFGSDMGVRTHAGSVRYPDVSVFCGDRSDPAHDRVQAFDDPRVVIEILSPSTARDDQNVKLDEYRAIPELDTIVFVDPEKERLRVVQRTGPGAWADVTHAEPADLSLPALDLIIPHEEVFARD